MKKVVALLVLIAAATAGGAWWLYHGNSGGGKCDALVDALPGFVPADGPPAVPEVAFADEAGAPVELVEFRGRGVVLNFWATWCPPCVREMPSLDRARVALANKGVDVLAVSNDRGGAEVVRAFYRETGVAHLPVLTDPAMKAARRFGVRGLPTTGLIDAHGRVLGHVEGLVEWDSGPVTAALVACLGPQKTGG